MNVVMTGLAKQLRTRYAAVLEDKTMYGLGIDIGGSGIKGALVDLSHGCLVGDRHRIPTPQPATPAAVLETVKAIIEHFDWSGPVGIGLPLQSPAALR